MAKKHPILKCDVENGNGRIYTKEAIEKILEKINEPVNVLIRYPDNNIFDIDYSKIVGQLDSFEIDHNAIFKANFKPVGLHPVEELLKISVIRPCFFGNINKDKTTTNLKFRYCALVLKDKDSYKGIIDHD